VSFISARPPVIRPANVLTRPFLFGSVTE